LCSDGAGCYYVFAGINALFYALVLATILMMHLAEAKPRTEEVPRRRAFAALQFRNWTQALAAVAVLIFGLGGIVKRGPQGAEFLFAGANSIPSPSDRVSENAAGDKERFIDGSTKLDAADIADIFASHFVEANLGTPVTPLKFPLFPTWKGRQNLQLISRRASMCRALKEQINRFVRHPSDGHTVKPCVIDPIAVPHARQSPESQRML
jgi:hypothetical protein